jgi:uncharacterized protein YbjT (DUF2867 family)
MNNHVFNGQRGHTISSRIAVQTHSRSGKYIGFQEVVMSLILTYGSTGSQGEPVARKLLKAGHQVRAVVRHPERAIGLQTRGAEIVQGDLSNLESLRLASAGADAVFLMLPFSAQGNPFELLGNALEAAKSAGVKFLVFNASGQVPAKPTGIPMLDFRIQLEEFIADCGIPNVILQPGAYMENFLGPWCLPSVKEHNTVAYPHRNEMRVSWMASEDIGSLAVAALERPELAGQRFRLGGPDTLDGAAIARAFTAGLGRQISYQAITPEAFGATMAQIMGPEAGEGIRIAYGHSNAQPNDAMGVDMTGVLEKLPVKLTTLEDWVRNHSNAFAASSVQPSELVR